MQFGWYRVIMTEKSTTFKIIKKNQNNIFFFYFKKEFNCNRIIFTGNVSIHTLITDLCNVCICESVLQAIVTLYIFNFTVIIILYYNYINIVDLRLMIIISSRW